MKVKDCDRCNFKHELKVGQGWCLKHRIRPVGDCKYKLVTHAKTTAPDLNKLIHLAADILYSTHNARENANDKS